MNKKYIVNLTDEESQGALKALQAPTIATTFRKRANILRHADIVQGILASQAEIAVRGGVSV